jgi:cyanophycinase-like exopeptidase
MIQKIDKNGYSTIDNGRVVVVDKYGKVKMIGSGNVVGSSNGYFPQGWG